MKKIFLLLFLLILSASVFAQKRAEADFQTLKKEIPELLEKSNVPGMSIAVIKNGKLVWTKGFGVKNAETKEPVTNETVFEAASLSKPVAAYAVLQLVDEGKLDLDTPLNKYLGNNYDVPDDERINQITARHVLSHSSGFPNWRRPRDSKTLPINFTPGEKFSYSGEGFVYLSKVVEKITGMEFDKFIEKRVSEPLGMKQSSFGWKEEYFKIKASNHDLFGKPRKIEARRDVNAAASLHTTAEDYAKFVIAVLEGKKLKKKTHKDFLTEQVFVNKEKHPQVAWGLGWGLEITDGEKSFFHWGDNGLNRSYIVASQKSKDAVLFFTNSTNGLSFLKEITDTAIGGERPSIAWLDYGRYDSPQQRFLKSVGDLGAEKALESYRKAREKDSAQKLTERQMNWVGYMIMWVGTTEDAIAVFKQNAEDFPESANVWDSLAESYMKNGEKELAIKYYKKTLELEPENKNAAEKLKELKADRKTAEKN